MTSTFSPRQKRSCSHGLVPAQGAVESGDQLREIRRRRRDRGRQRNPCRVQGGDEGCAPHSPAPCLAARSRASYATIQSVLGSWVGARRTFNLSFFITAPRIFYPKTPVLTPRHYIMFLSNVCALQVARTIRRVASRWETIQIRRRALR